MVNKIWGLFILIGIIYCFSKGQLDTLNTTILDSASKAFSLVVKIFPVMALWLGICKIAEESGLLKKISNKISFVLKYIFPEIPKGHVSLSYISSNIIANMFGLGNAATPFGLKAMSELQKINNKKDTASVPMITFLVLNTAGVTIVPTTVLALRISYGSVNPSEIIVPGAIATFCSCIGAVLIDYFIRKRGKN